MKILIVYANPNPESLSGRVKNLVSGTLKKKGYEVEIRDLYQMQFNPVLTAADQAANAAGNLPADIKKEQEFIKWADMIYFIYPIWWTGLPAIIKGYFDRVLSYGFAYSYDAKGLVKHMGGKKVVILNNYGSPLATYEGAMHDSLKMTSDIGVMDFCGFELIEHKFFPSASSASEEAKSAYLEEIRLLCEKLH